MKKILSSFRWSQPALLMLVLTAMMLTACNNKSEDVYDAVPFQAEKDGPWGLLSTDGTVLYSPRFDAAPTCVTEGLFFVADTTGVSQLYRAAKGEPELVCPTRFNFAHCFIGGKALVKLEDDTPCLIDTDGEVIRKLDHVNGDYVYRIDMMDDGYMQYYTSNGMQGLLTPDGDVAIKNDYHEMFCKYGVAVGYPGNEAEFDSLAAKGKAEAYIMDYNGQQLGKFNGQWHVSDISENKSIVYRKNIQEDIAGLMDIHGDTIVPHKYEFILCTDNLYEYFIENEGFVIMDANEQTVFKSSNRMLSILDAEHLVSWPRVEDSEKYQFQIIDLKGKPINNSTYEKLVGSFSAPWNVVMAQKKDQSCVKVNPDGTETAIDAKVYDIKEFNEYVCKENELCIIGQLTRFTPEFFMGKWKIDEEKDDSIDIPKLSEMASIDIPKLSEIAAMCAMCDTYVEFTDRQDVIFTIAYNHDGGRFNFNMPGTYTLDSGELQIKFDPKKCTVTDFASDQEFTAEQQHELEKKLIESFTPIAVLLAGLSEESDVTISDLSFSHGNKIEFGVFTFVRM